MTGHYSRAPTRNARAFSPRRQGSRASLLDHLLAQADSKLLTPERWMRWRREPEDSSAPLAAQDQALLDLLSANEWRLPKETSSS